MRFVLVFYKEQTCRTIVYQLFIETFSNDIFKLTIKIKFRRYIQILYKNSVIFQLHQRVTIEPYQSSPSRLQFGNLTYDNLCDFQTLRYSELCFLWNIDIKQCIQIVLLQLTEEDLDDPSELVRTYRFVFTYDQLSQLGHPIKIIIITLTRTQMKNHERQLSHEFKMFKPHTLNLSPYRLECIPRNFKKKLLIEPSNSTQVMSRQEHYRKSQSKSSPNKSQNKLKSNRKRSLQKFISNHKTTQRTSINHNQPQPTTLSTRSKLLKINSILGQKTNGSQKQMLAQFYTQFEEYASLTQEWKKLEIFDEIDKLVQNLIEHNMNMMESILEKTCYDFKEQLQRCEKTIGNLMAEKYEMQHQLSVYANIEQAIRPMRDKMMQDFQKSQWSTFIFNFLAMQPFDVESFIRQVPLYQKWIAPVTLQPKATDKHQLQHSFLHHKPQLLKPKQQEAQELSFQEPHVKRRDSY